MGIGLRRRDRGRSGRDPVSKVTAGDYGPVPKLAASYLTLAGTGGLEGLLTTKNTFYNGDETKPLLLLADGAYLEDQARAEHLGGDQWGMMNETGSYPGQPWMWLYTFWYQVKPFSTSGNADALVWGLMMAAQPGLHPAALHPRPTFPAQASRRPQADLAARLALRRPRGWKEHTGFKAVPVGPWD